MDKRLSIGTVALLSIILIGLGVLARKSDDTVSAQAYKDMKEETVLTTEDVVLADQEEITSADKSEIVERPTVAIKTYYDVNLSHELQDYIIKRCEQYNISPSLVMAIIERESNCNEKAVGDNGNSLGLMQIQPKWHQWRADKLGCLDWYNAYDNVTVGIDILGDLFSKYGDDVYMVLMAYNGGPSYAERMSSKGEISKYAREVDARAEELERCDVAREEEKIWD